MIEEGGKSGKRKVDELDVPAEKGGSLEPATKIPKVSTTADASERGNDTTGSSSTESSGSGEAGSGEGGGTKTETPADEPKTVPPTLAEGEAPPPPSEAEIDKITESLGLRGSAPAPADGDDAAAADGGDGKKNDSDDPEWKSFLLFRRSLLLLPPGQAQAGAPINVIMDLAGKVQEFMNNTQMTDGGIQVLDNNLGAEAGNLPGKKKAATGPPVAETGLQSFVVNEETGEVRSASRVRCRVRSSGAMYSLELQRPGR